MGDRAPGPPGSQHRIAEDRFWRVFRGRSDNHPDPARKSQDEAYTHDFAYPLRTVTGLNAREIWQVKAGRVKNERRKTANALRKALGVPRWECASVVSLPALVTLTRIGPRKCDDDAVPPALKAVRDAIAAYLGLDDGCDYVRWAYAQERGEFAVRVRIEPLAF